jgi:hypothetical protein
MPSRNEIVESIFNLKQNAEHIIRRGYLQQLSQLTGRDTIIYATAFTANRQPDLSRYFYSITLEDMQGFMSALYGLKGDALDLILHSPGGSLEAADQIVQYLRSKYRHIRAIVPQNAMSAATMLACACDQIVMGKHSALGPIDPQITFPTQSGHFTAPAQEILDEFERARKEVAAEPAVAPLWIGKMKDYPPGLLEICQSAIELSREKVTDWLANGMFKGLPDARARAQTIADWLADTNTRKTHGTPVTIEQAQAIGLLVEPLEADQAFQEAVMGVFHATEITLEITGIVKLVENQDGVGWFVSMGPEQ